MVLEKKRVWKDVQGVGGERNTSMHTREQRKEAGERARAWVVGGKRCVFTVRR